MLGEQIYRGALGAAALAICFHLLHYQIREPCVNLLKDLYFAYVLSLLGMSMALCQEVWNWKSLQFLRFVGVFLCFPLGCELDFCIFGAKSCQSMDWLQVCVSMDIGGTQCEGL